jgi:LAO/AO transport system kinase
MGEPGALERGDRLAVAQALNDVEDDRPEARARSRSLLAHLLSTHASDRAHRVGVTGPPGVGKSCLVAAMARALRSTNPPRSVGILAVDPSSLRSGGALLGDRIRIATDPEDMGVFVRSLATRGELGGIARAIPGELVVLSAAFDVVIVETVGVGQSETDVRDVVDALVFVVQPGAGDTLQHLKAGVMETPDLFVVNKVDVGEVARRTRSELQSALTSLAQAGVGRAPGIVSTSARDGTGIVELLAALAEHRADAEKSGLLASRRRAGTVAQALRAFRRRYGELGVERMGGERSLRAAIERAVDAVEPVEALVEWLNPFQ